MRAYFVVLAVVLLYGCSQVEEEVVDFRLGYLLMDKNNKTTEGPLSDSISFPRDATYFHIRANITSTDGITHYLAVLDQHSDMYGLRLPLYAEESINGFERRWQDITGLEEGDGSVVPLVPGEAKQLEQPVFFFNQYVSQGIPDNMLLEIRIVNASGRVLGTRRVGISVTGSD